jgi:hypothetical protein
MSAALMTVSLLVFVALSLVGLAILIWLTGKPLPEEASLDVNSRIEDLVPLHTQHFPQLRQALDSTDSRYMQQKATPDLLRKWRDDRRRILMAFVAGLGEDFAKLDRLGRTIASLSPKLSRQEELKRIWLNVRFRVNIRIVKLWIHAGGTRPLMRLRYLTTLLGDLSARTEAAMARLEMRPS